VNGNTGCELLKGQSKNQRLRSG